MSTDSTADATSDEDAHEAPSRAMGDLFLGCVLIAVCLWAAWEALGMPRRGDLGLITSPGFTPLVVCTVIIVLSLIMVTRAVLDGAVAETSGRMAQLVRSYQARRVLILSAMITGYVLLIGVLDFTLVTALYLLVTFVYVRAGGWVTIVAATVTGALLTAVVIPYAFTMPTP